MRKVVETQELPPPPAQLLDAHLQLPRELLLGRHALKLRLELDVRALDLAGTGTDRAGHPVEPPQFVENRALDAGDRVGLEADLAAQVKSLDRGDQATETIGDQVGLVDVRRKPGAHPTGDVLDQRRIGHHQPVARLLIVRGLVAPPQITELDRFYVRLHQDSRDPADRASYARG